MKNPHAEFELKEDMMQRRTVIISAVCLVLCGAWFFGAAALLAAEKTSAKAPKAIIKTKFGEMEIAFFPDKAPKHL